MRGEDGVTSMRWRDVEADQDGTRHARADGLRFFKIHQLEILHVRSCFHPPGDLHHHPVPQITAPVAHLTLGEMEVTMELSGGKSGLLKGWRG